MDKKQTTSMFASNNIRRHSAMRSDRAGSRAGSTWRSWAEHGRRFLQPAIFGHILRSFILHLSYIS